MTTEIIEPLCGRVLVRKDEDKKETKGGIILPDSKEIPVITGRVVAIAADVENDHEVPIRQYDKVLINPSHAIPVELESDNKLFIIPVEDLVAVFRKDETPEDD
jgi:chaperonin GroES